MLLYRKLTIYNGPRGKGDGVWENFHETLFHSVQCSVVKVLLCSPKAVSVVGRVDLFRLSDSFYT
jgi:hypothetical protein